MAELLVTREAAAAWLEAYRRAWETQDTGLIVSIFTADGTYRETPFDEPERGHAGVRHYWEANVLNQRDIAFEFELLGVEGKRAFAHWRSTFTWQPTGERHRLDGIFVLTFGGRGDSGLLCSALDEWWHITTPIVVR